MGVVCVVCRRLLHYSALGGCGYLASCSYIVRHHLRHCRTALLCRGYRTACATAHHGCLARCRGRYSLCRYALWCRGMNRLCRLDIRCRDRLNARLIAYARCFPHWFGHASSDALAHLRGLLNLAVYGGLATYIGIIRMMRSRLLHNSALCHRRNIVLGSDILRNHLRHFHRRRTRNASYGAFHHGCTISLLCRRNANHRATLLCRSRSMYRCSLHRLSDRLLGRLITYALRFCRCCGLDRFNRTRSAVDTAVNLGSFSAMCVCGTILCGLLHSTALSRPTYLATRSHIIRYHFRCFWAFRIMRIAVCTIRLITFVFFNEYLSLGRRCATTRIASGRRTCGNIL